MPNKKNIILALVCVVILGVIAFSNYKSKNPEIPTKNDPNGIEVKEISDTGTDEDWREILKNSQISTSSKIATLLSGNNGGTNGELTATEKFSRDFFTSYLELKSTKGEITAEDQQNIIDELLSKDYIGNTSYKKYSLGDIKTISDTSFSLRSYGNSVGEIMVKNAIDGSEYEVSVFQKALQNEDENELKKLDLNIREYKGIIADLLTLSVGASFAPTHLKLLNASSRVLYSIEQMRNAMIDPVGSLLVMKNYNDAVSELTASLLTLKNTFNQKGIVFTQQEYGYLLIKGL